ncbi:MULTISPECIES: LysR substrate-binding domain-containing protein [unclassified Roseitalea]|uniref:LysR substrate-binding domain-containing protein n=1 Tax=unclassified Roseitalea TaxID=2639107 RepID=UPI00273E6132|nr:MULTISPECIES: LysR substrate-binding domain-containing protein [unclassified Roseitalea]
MRLRHVEVFHALMLTHSVTRAAEYLNTSQPTASRYLAELEGDIGFSLFTRRSGKLFPTPEADALFAEVQRSFSGLDRIREVARGIAEFRTDRLRISSISSFALGRLADIMPGFRARYPNVDICVDVGSFEEVVRNVVVNRCEIGFVAYPVPHKGLTQIPVVRAAALCAMPSGHRLANREKVDVNDLDNENFIALDRGVPSGGRVAQIFADAEVRPNVVLETKTAAVACAFVKRGMGVAILDPLTVGAFVDAQMSARRFQPEIAFQFSAIVRSERPPTRIGQKLLDTVSASMAPARASAVGASSSRSRECGVATEDGATR